MNLRRTMLPLLFVAMTSSMAIGQKIAIFSDVHVTPGNANDKALREAVEDVNKRAVDLVIVSGDLTNEGSDEQIVNVKSILDKVKHPMVVIPGNHENNWSQSATKTFIDVFGSDRFVTEIDSLVIIGINCGPYMKMGDGHIKQEDLHWLKKTLDERVTPGKRVLSINHYPIRENDLDNWRDYAEVLLQYPVIGHINGHYHSWIRYEVGDIEASMVRALDMKNSYGYTLVDIDPQWVHIYDVQTGKSPKPKYAFAAKTKHKPLADAGTKEWSNPEGFTVTKVWADSASVFTRLDIDENNVYFGNSLGEARAIDKRTGELRWSVPIGASLFSRPVSLNKGIVAVPAHDRINYIDKKTGKVRRTTASKVGPYIADGLYADGMYLQGGYKRFERINPSNGKIVWSYDSLTNYCQAAPVVIGNDVIFGAWDTNLRCLDVATGRLKWVWNNGKSVNLYSPGNVVPVVTDDMVIIVAPDRYMTALDRKTGKELWRDNSHKYRESLGVSADGTRVYAKTMEGELVAVDATSREFKELWTVDMGLGYEHAPCIVVERDGVVYAGSRRGILTAVDPVAKTVLWSLPIGVSEINGIDIDPTTGDVWVSLIEGTIYRIEKNK